MKLTKPITIYAADRRGDATNCVYPHVFPVDSAEVACAVFAVDTTFARYENNYRSNKTFLSSDALPMDCDNDHSDDPADWITPEIIESVFADIPDWAGKYVGAVLRIAGLLHVAENPTLTDFEELSADTMQNAVQIGDYFIAHAKAAFSLMGADPVIKQCEYLLEHIRRANLEQFSKRDAMRMCRQFKTANDLQPVLDRLCEYGYLAPVPTPDTRSSGRKPSDVYRTNPAVFEQ